MSLRFDRWGFERLSRGRSPKRKALALFKTVEGTGPSLHGHPPVHRTDDPRRTLQEEPLDLDFPERSRSDQSLDIQIQSAPIGKLLLERAQAALPSLDSRFFAQPVLQEQELSSGLEYPTDLCDSPSGIPDAAQRPGAHHAVEPPVLERKFLGSLHPEVHINVAPLDPAAGDLCHADPRIDRSEVTDVFGIMPKVEPCPKPDLQDLAVRLGEHF